MTTIRRSCCDLFKFANVNVDHLTETTTLAFYQTYMARSPDYCHVAKAPNGSEWLRMAYIMKKVKGHGENWQSCELRSLPVAPEYRRQQLERKLMIILEDITAKAYKGYFAHLFMGASNIEAIPMYQKVCQHLKPSELTICPLRVNSIFHNKKFKYQFGKLTYTTIIC